MWWCVVQGLRIHLFICSYREFQLEKNLTNVQKNAASNFNRRTGRFEVGSVRFKKHRPNDLKTDIDAHGRPIQKIAVLCGPPGIHFQFEIGE